MKNHSVSSIRVQATGAMLALGVLGAGLLPAFAPLAQAAPLKSVLEIWPGQRVLLVLPLTVGPDWNGGPELAEAIKPIIRPSLQTALTDTNKFSVTLPYRFDPILRRAVVENRISQDIITPFVDSPSLATAQPVFSQLKFEQVPMVVQAQIEELRVGGTPKIPTAQLQVSAKLYEIGGDGPFRSVVVTSDPAVGKTPEERLQNAASNAFEQIAAAFVKPPDTFQLPASLGAEIDAQTDVVGDAMNPTGTNPRPVTPTPPVPLVPPAMVPSATPRGITPQPGMPVIPVLPQSDPPLGVTAGGEKALGR